MTTTTTQFVPFDGVTVADLQTIIYILSIIAGLVVVMIGATAFFRFKYRKEQNRLTEEYIRQQEHYTGALKAEADYYRQKNELMASEIFNLKERMAREIGELRGQLAAMARIVSGHCPYYTPNDDLSNPGCIYCTNCAAWGRIIETEGGTE